MLKEKEETKKKVPVACKQEYQPSIQSNLKLFNDDMNTYPNSVELCCLNLTDST